MWRARRRSAARASSSKAAHSSSRASRGASRCAGGLSGQAFWRRVAVRLILVRGGRYAAARRSSATCNKVRRAAIAVPGERCSSAARQLCAPALALGAWGRLGLCKKCSRHTVRCRVGTQRLQNAASAARRNPRVRLQSALCSTQRRVPWNCRLLTKHLDCALAPTHEEYRQKCVLRRQRSG